MRAGRTCFRTLQGLPILLVMTSLGCGSSSTRSDSRALEGNDSGALEGIATYSPSEPDGMDAILSGSVVFNDGCLQIEQGGRTVTPAFPDELSVELGEVYYAGRELTSGMDVELRGGENPDPVGISVPSACIDRSTYFIVSAVK